ncbi:MAG: glycerophosphodiester phosphodiesterase family protein [Desulfobacterales bacterium]
MIEVWIELGIIMAALGAVVCYFSTSLESKPNPPHSPLIIAHRAGGGQWPQNSRTAVLNCIARAGVKDPAQRYHGIEIDIVLTKDGHPVLSHDPWVHTTLCRTISGEPIGDRILIRDLTLAELQSQFICGGVADKDFPRVVPKGEKIMTLDEVLVALESAPEMVLYLDVKIDGDLTASAEAYASAISKCLASARLPNRLYIEGPSVESLDAYRTAIQAEFVAVLSYPPFSVRDNPALTALKARWLTKLRLRSPLRKAQTAKADAVVGPTQVITRSAARKALDNGVAVVLFTPNTREDLFEFCAWPVDMLITDYPNLGHCP